MMNRVWQSEIDALAHRQEKRVVVMEAEQYDSGSPPSPLLEFAAWLDGIMSEIPEEYHSAAQIEFDSTSSYYDSHYGHVEVSYRRPETDAEMAERRASV